jgi:hypothetical protein
MRSRSCWARIAGAAAGPRPLLLRVPAPAPVRVRVPLCVPVRRVRAYVRVRVRTLVLVPALVLLVSGREWRRRAGRSPSCRRGSRWGQRAPSMTDGEPAASRAEGKKIDRQKHRRGYE